MATKYNITKPEKYTKDGVEKTIWHNIGVLTEFEKTDGTISRLIEIPAIGLKAQAFPFAEKTAKPVENVVEHETSTEDIDPDSIPF